MKKLFLLFILCLFTKISFAQFGVSYHQSSIPFVGLNYQVNEKLLPELRIGTNSNMEFTSVELDMNFIYEAKESHQLYVGVGAYIQSSLWLSIPIGLNLYPFETKRFGFHMEIAPLINDLSYLRGSWGIRYRFN